MIIIKSVTPFTYLKLSVVMFNKLGTAFLNYQLSIKQLSIHYRLSLRDERTEAPPTQLLLEHVNDEMPTLQAGRYVQRQECIP